MIGVTSPLRSSTCEKANRHRKLVVWPDFDSSRKVAPSFRRDIMHDVDFSPGASERLGLAAVLLLSGLGLLAGSEPEAAR